MTQTSNRIFDEMARLMNDAAGVAQGRARANSTRCSAPRPSASCATSTWSSARNSRRSRRWPAWRARRTRRSRRASRRWKAKRREAGQESGKAAAAPSTIFGFLALSGPRRYKPAATRGPRHPWRLAAFAGGRKCRLFHWLR